MILSTNCYLTKRCSKGNKCIPEKFCIKLFKEDFLFNESNLPIELRNQIDLRIDENGTDREEFIKLKNIENNIYNFVSEGKNLYIYSTTTGNGKTSWAIRFIQSYFDSIWHTAEFSCKGLFINVPRFLLSIKEDISVGNEYAQHIKENIYKADIVVFDDIGTKGVTSFEHEMLLNIINARIDAHKCNIYTSNIPPAELDKIVGNRLYSRIINLSEVIELKGADKRGLVII